jgi:hypothetical protein
MAENTSGSQKPVRVGLFDIRVIIGGLIGIYGIILVITGLFAGDTQIAKSDGLNINLVGGICMVVGAAAFIIWARLRPIVVPPEAVEDEGTDSSAH